jgi:hypothetical protein
MTQQEMDAFVQLVANTLTQLKENDLTSARAGVTAITEWIRLYYPNVTI